MLLNYVIVVTMCKIYFRSVVYNDKFGQENDNILIYKIAYFMIKLYNLQFWINLKNCYNNQPIQKRVLNIENWFWCGMSIIKVNFYQPLLGVA